MHYVQIPNESILLKISFFADKQHPATQCSEEDLLQQTTVKLKRGHRCKQRQKLTHSCQPDYRLLSLVLAFMEMPGGKIKKIITVCLVRFKQRLNKQM